MKRNVFLLVIGVALVLLVIKTSPSTPTQAAENTTTRTITVTGDADVKVVPDQVDLYLGVETWDKDLAIAKNQNDERVKKLLAVVKDFGVESKYIQTDQISVEPRYQDNFTKRDFVAFFVRKSIVVTLKDISKFENLLTGVLNGGATHIHGVQYRTTELRQHRDTARALAIQAAKEKATAMTKELGMMITKAVTIHEDYSGWWSPYSSYWGSSMAQNVTQNVSGAGSAPLDSAVSLGQITVNARVTITFGIE